MPTNKNAQLRYQLLDRQLYAKYGLSDDEKSYEESVHSVSLNATCEQLKANLNSDEKLLIISLSDAIAPISEIKLKPLLKPLYEKKSNTLLKDKVIYPLIKLGLVAQTHPETPRHPKQKYYLTELGKAMLKYINGGTAKVTRRETSDSQDEHI